MKFKLLISQFFQRFFPKKKTTKSSSDSEEILFLKIKIAELENNLMKLGEAVQKTNETIVLMQDNFEKIYTTTQQGYQLAKQHEDIFNKILEEKLLVFGLTKKTKVLQADKDKPKPE